MKKLRRILEVSLRSEAALIQRLALLGPCANWGVSQPCGYTTQCPLSLPQEAMQPAHRIQSRWTAHATSNGCTMSTERAGTFERTPRSLPLLRLSSTPGLTFCHCDVVAEVEPILGPPLANVTLTSGSGLLCLG